MDPELRRRIVAGKALRTQLELDLLLADLKPVWKHEHLAFMPPTDEELEELVRTLEGHGLSWKRVEARANISEREMAARSGGAPRPSPTYIVSKDPALVEIFAGVDDPYRCGELLGYPRCCLDARKDNSEEHDLHFLSRGLAATKTVVHASLIPLGDVGLTEYFPCSLDCSASLERVAGLRAFRGEAEEPPAPPAPMLYVSTVTGCRLLEASPISNGFAYSSVEQTGWPSPEDRQALDALDAGDSFQIPERNRLVVRRGEETVADMRLHAILPLPLGLPNHFDAACLVPPE